MRSVQHGAGQNAKVNSWFHGLLQQEPFVIQLPKRINLFILLATGNKTLVRKRVPSPDSVSGRRETTMGRGRQRKQVERKTDDDEGMRRNAGR